MICAVTVGGFALSDNARGEVMFGGFSGYNRGTLTRKVDESFGAISTQGYVGFNFNGFNIHAFFQSADLAYDANGQAYEGIYSAAGPGIGYNYHVKVFKKSGKFVTLLQVPISGTYTVLSKSSGMVNNVSYVHSSLTTLQGGQAMQFLAGYDHLLRGAGGNNTGSARGRNLYVGLYLGFLKQDFATQSTHIKTNNSILAPPSSGKQQVSYSMTMTSFNVGLNYDL